MSNLAVYLIVFLVGIAIPLMGVRCVEVRRSEEGSGCFLDLVLGMIAVLIASLFYAGLATGA